MRARNEIAAAPLPDNIKGTCPFMGGADCQEDCMMLMEIGRKSPYKLCTFALIGMASAYKINLQEAIVRVWNEDETDE